MVIAGRRGDRFIKASGVLTTLDALRHHVSSILRGLYSLAGQPDQALIEYRVQLAPEFEPIGFAGVPDVHTLVFRGVLVMAMLRLPTRRSDGKANLHQGAVGVGVDIATGRTVHAVLGGQPVLEHPDSLTALADFQIPERDRLLRLAASCFELSELGHIGVDFVFDRPAGPMMLEMNARPGLSIQLAHRTGLLGRLDAVATDVEPAWDAARRVAYAKQHFAS